MANDVYTYISYGDEKKDWDLFTAEIAEIEYNQSQPQDASGMNKLMASLFPEHKGNYYDWDYDVSGDVLDTKWCNIHNVDEGSIEFHSAWNAPTKLIKRILTTFGRNNFHLRIEDNDWGVIGDAESRGNDYSVKCLTATYYQKFVAALKGRYKSAKELLEENTFYNDDVIDRYEAVDFIQPRLFSDLDDVVCELSCMGQQGEWKFNKDLLLNGLSNTSLKEALA
jgi:hypothetical protein